ncbi:uncharacterized protein LOC129567898 [Sitodiplosis mosellana]|uniref:uncharacterized protein LOC129567898 n=1 Tax=Sitodiplosis mosellana TaxID=263140 RepID=UPI0024438A1D|nr:uncharacterized protein LOC129567898 [Sitodiplosis mosellana]
MSKIASIPRWNYLSLNIKDLKKSTSGTKLQVTKNDESTPPINHSAILPWITVFKHFQMTRDKVGMDLLKGCRNGFHLDDPYIRNTRFFTEYHRLHDPGLKRYYNSIPVKNRMKKLQLINDGNDAICTNKEMIEYLRYLDSIRSRNDVNSMKEKEENRLSNHFHNLKELKKKETQYTDIFRRKKYKREPTSSAHLKKQQTLKLQKHIDQKRKAIERAAKAKTELKGQIKHKNEQKDIKTIAKRKIVFESNSKRRTKIREMTKKRLSAAEHRKKTLQEEKRVSKMTKNYEFFEKCMKVGEKNYYKNIELFEEYSQNRNEGMKERQKMMQKIHELNEIGMVKFRQQISLCKFKQEQCQVLVDKIMKKIPAKIKKFKPMIKPKDLEEVSRRFSMLTPEFVSNCVEKVYGILQNMELPTSTSDVMSEVTSLMIKHVALIPTVNPINCQLVRQRLAEIITRFVIDIKDKHVQRMVNELKREKRGENKCGILYKGNDLSSSSSSSDGGKFHVCFAETTEIEEKSETDEFKQKKSIYSSKFDKIYDLDDVIHRELERFFKVVVTNKFDIPDDYNTRDFVHLYDFQKYYIYTSVERLRGLVEMKQEHDWIIYEHSSWKGEQFDLESITLMSAEMVMNNSRTPDDTCECVRRISKYICVQMDMEFEIEKQKLLTDENRVANIEKCSSQPDSDSAKQ